MKRNNYSFTSLMEYCQYLKETAGESKAKSGGRLTACRVILKNLLPEELKDVRTIDVDSAAAKYASATGSKKKTVVEYRNRVKRAIEMFTEYVDSMKDDKAEETTAVSNKATPPSEEGTIVEQAPAKTRRYPKPITAAVNAISLQVRPDFLAQLILPLDLTAAEARHLCKLINALPMDQE